MVPLSSSNRRDFFRVHCEEAEAGWCFCTAWWVPTWDGFSDRSAADNLALREHLFDQGHDDGFLLFENEDPVGWCQVGPRDRFQKLRTQYELKPNPSVWAVTCFVIAPPQRGRGLARFLLRGVLLALSQAGIEIVQAFPKPGDALPVQEAWRGSEKLFRSEGFQVAWRGGAGPILQRKLTAPSL